MTREGLLAEAIKYNEQAVRAIDTKAQIFIAAVLFGVNALGSMFVLMGGAPLARPDLPLVWVSLTGLCLLLLVRVVAPVPFRSGGRRSRLIFTNTQHTFEDIIEVAKSIDVIEELSAELHDIEAIRRLKTARMRTATLATGILVLGYTVQVLLLPYIS